MLRAVKHRAQTAVRRLAGAVTSTAVFSLSLAVFAAPEPVSFRNDVMAVLSKTGCNMGTCHGNKHGKGGFKLSLRGEDGAGDYEALTQDVFGRRVNPLDPDQSLLLLKATTQLAHEGGLRFRPDSQEYAILRRWIAAGMPQDKPGSPTAQELIVTPLEQVLVQPAREVRLKVMAKYSDGSRRDLTRLAVYEPSNALVTVTPDGRVTFKEPGETTVIVRYLHLQVPVRLAAIPARRDFVWKQPPANNFIDQHVFEKLRKLRLNPSELCRDEVFLRRAFLDLLGLLPTAEEARAFVADPAKDKRQRLVDRLLARPEFADFWALKWADLLRVEERTLDPRGVKTFHGWIRDSLAANKPLDQFAREIIAGRGSTYTNAPANYYRANRDPIQRAEGTAQVFLGTRLNCAQCHNHPFDRWTQDDYYNWAGLFARVDYKILENKRTDKNDKHEFKGDQIVFLASKGEVRNPRLNQPATPKFLGGPAPEITGERDELQSLADWLTSPDNAMFARTQVNRVWFHLMGRGLVDPVDDFRMTNPASHPALLDALAKEFVRQRFDLRHLIRLIMTSRTYQLASEPDATNAGDEINYSHSLVRRLTAEQLLDAYGQVAGVPLELEGLPAGARSAQSPFPRNDRKSKKSGVEQFLEVFGKPARLIPSECERSNETTMRQAFNLISGETINALVADRNNRLTRLLAGGRSDREIVEELYWTALTRPPTGVEAEQSLAYLAKAKDRRAALEDLLWGLLNAKEFVLRQ
jgi:hypothetical protein